MTRSTKPRRARIGLMALTAAALTFVALPGSVDASTYPLNPGEGAQVPPGLPEQVPPAGGVQGATVSTTGALPATGGSETTQILWIASSALLAGVVISGASMRRRNAHSAVS